MEKVQAYLVTEKITYIEAAHWHYMKRGELFIPEYGIKIASASFLFPSIEEMQEWEFRGVEANRSKLRGIMVDTTYINHSREALRNAEENLACAIKDIYRSSIKPVLEENIERKQG